MTMLYPIVLETEDDGAVSAYVPGLPVYAAADTHARAERAIRGLLEAYLQEHPSTKPEGRAHHSSSCAVRRPARPARPRDGLAALAGARDTAGSPTGTAP